MYYEKQTCLQIFYKVGEFEVLRFGGVTELQQVLSDYLKQFEWVREVEIPKGKTAPEGLLRVVFDDTKKFLEVSEAKKNEKPEPKPPIVRSEDERKAIESLLDRDPKFKEWLQDKGKSEATAGYAEFWGYIFRNWSEVMARINKKVLNEEREG